MEMTIDCIDTCLLVTFSDCLYGGRFMRPIVAGYPDAAVLNRTYDLADTN